MKTAAGVFDLLELKTQPVAVAFLEDPPEGLPRIEEAAPSGCAYWKLAGRGRSFYTEAGDHHGCPIGSYTHGIDLPANIATELADDELYFAVAGPQLEAVAEKLSTIVNANRELEKFHRGRIS